MFKIVVLAAVAGLVSSPIAAEEFALQIGGTVAAPGFQTKTAPFAFRAKGCPETAKLKVVGSAEGLVSGSRRSIPLVRILAAQAPGAYAVSMEWPAEGVWLVNLTAHCDTATAGALVPLGPGGFGFVRETIKLFSRAATAAEVEAAVKALGASPPPSSNK